MNRSGKPSAIEGTVSLIGLTHGGLTEYRRVFLNRMSYSTVRSVTLPESQVTFDGLQGHSVHPTPFGARHGMNPLGDGWYILIGLFALQMNSLQTQLGLLSNWVKRIAYLYVLIARSNLLAGALSISPR
jgi:hypothetical protein